MRWTVTFLIAFHAGAAAQPQVAPQEQAALDALARFYGMQFATAQTAQDCAMNIEQQRGYFQLMEGWAGLIRGLPTELHRSAAEATLAARQRYALMAQALRCETARDEHTANLRAWADAIRR